jgi:hypothetical protein
MIATAELKAQRRITAAFIAADAQTIVLLRRSRTPDGAGGIETGPQVEQAPQTFRLLPQEDGATARTNADGESATPEYMLQGYWDANMQRFDEFVIGDRRYQIVYIDDRQYEIKGEATYCGE